MICLDFREVARAGEVPVEQFAALSRKFPDPDMEGACLAFSRQVAKVQATIECTYAMAAQVAKRQDKLESEQEVWSIMGHLCEVALVTVKSLKDQYPYCGTPELFDVLLDYKLACDERRRHLAEEIACQGMEIPKGLFPELT